MKRSTPSPAFYRSTSKNRSPLKRKFDERADFAKHSTNGQSSEAINISSSLTQAATRDSSRLVTSKSLHVKRNSHFKVERDASTRRHRKLEGIQNQYTVAKEARQQRELKRTLCKALERRYGVKLPYIEMCCLTEREILEHAKTVWRDQLAINAWKQMKHWYLQTQALRNVEVELARVHIAAYTIQLYWHKYKVSVLASKQHRKRLDAAALKIQKVFRGYRVRKHTYKKLMLRRIENNLFDIKLMWRLVVQTAAIKIWRNWRAYKGRMNLKVWRTRKAMLESKKNRLQLQNEFQSKNFQLPRRESVAAKDIRGPPALTRSKTIINKQARARKTPRSGKLPTQPKPRTFEPRSAYTKLALSDASTVSPNSFITDSSLTDKTLAGILEETRK
eukprot:CAMPEP_0204900528 /NCGR_PEP_ID=MMETSP1397-20131031/2524_1 /ASSEMBLY_ACC=CAM_ASM_000891 /TAXON_ID=49980 /ORGANISM="Climacostomum Climacostomum virens, Strain Stock W-24" /LENGTH=389 /DNA_ID=CAMNT_0052068691 /DNA_START=265 /DNA_END=1434 /DNA_ORIENTATION=+